jgi:hypothetical protein
MSTNPETDVLAQLCHRYERIEAMTMTALVATFLLALTFVFLHVFLPAKVTNPIFVQSEIFFVSCALVWLFCLGRVGSCATTLSCALMVRPSNEDQRVNIIKGSNCVQGFDDFIVKVLRVVSGILGKHLTGG